MTDSDLQPLTDRWLARWIAGGPAPDAGEAPAAWRDALAPDDELGLLCLALQWRQFALDAVLPADAATGLPLPPATLALLPDPLRLRFRRFARAASADALVGVLRALAQQGHMAHPFDWLPGAEHEGLPTAYDPWRRWAAVQRQPGSAMPGRDDDDWTLLPPADRRREFARRRTADPAAAREALAAALGQFGAEHRLALVEQLALRLCADDLPLLQSLATDRSERIQQTAARLRARLGDAAPLDATAQAELREDFEIGKTGLIHRRARIALKPLKTAAQHAARRARLAAVDWAGLAAALGHDAETLADAWAPGDEDDAALLDSLAHTAPQPVADRILQRIVAGELTLRGNVPVGGALDVMLERTGPAGREAVVRIALSKPGPYTRFGDLQRLLEAPLADVDLRALRSSPPWNAFQNLLRAHTDEGASPLLLQETAALAALVARPTATELLRHFIEQGVRAADPVLDPLVLVVECPATPQPQGTPP
jgi:hypothetical protein